jgi:division protein CdvB (Snf7/Vps24/ESCRT-III family)
MKNNGVDDEITFDSNSGISEEEQREILEKINGIAEKNRRSL